jgi:glycosyltransferase involved in cell wall biosynthesis
VAHDGVNAALVAERDVVGLADRIDSLLREPGRRAELGARARALALRDHGWDKVAEAMERAYRRAHQGTTGEAR